MVLASHAVVGATLAQLVPGHPVKAFFLGFVSHFILDAIPHWDYKLRSDKPNTIEPLAGNIETRTALLYDVPKIFLDASLGMFLVLLLLPGELSHTVTLLAGAVGGMLPDPLQFAYYRIRREPLTSLQKFHLWIHTKHRLTGYPLPGATLQAISALLLIFIVSLIAP